MRYEGALFNLQMGARSFCHGQIIYCNPAQRRVEKFQLILHIVQF